MILPALLGGLLATAVITGAEEAPKPLPKQPPPPPPARTPGEVPPHMAVPTPAEAIDIRAVMDAYIDELAEQSDARMARAMASIARRTLTNHQPAWSSIVIPCDQRVHKALPEMGFLRRIADALAESYKVGVTIYPARWTHPKFGSVAICAVVFHPKQGMPPTRDETLKPMADALRKMVGRTGEFIEYGATDRFGLLDVIVNTIVASAVGTVTSMGTQALVRSAGGEPRLARLVRKYKRAKARGDEGRIRRMLGKIKRTAERLKGRQVDWNEVEGLIVEYDAMMSAQQPEKMGTVFGIMSPFPGAARTVVAELQRRFGNRIQIETITPRYADARIHAAPELAGSIQQAIGQVLSGRMDHHVQWPAPQGRSPRGWFIEIRESRGPYDHVH